MNINPFDLLKNAQKIQEQMSEMQEKLGAVKVTGSAGGGMAEIDMNGRLEAVAVRISPEAVDPTDVGLLQDLILAAINDAAEKARGAIKDQVTGMSGGLGF
jgi:hypothetical protein